MSELDWEGAWEWEADLLTNLNRFLGIDLKYILGIPNNIMVGDRMLYLLKGGQKEAARVQEQVVLHGAVDPELKMRPTHPHVVKLDSIPLDGVPQDIQLRITDVMEDLCFHRGQREYLEAKYLRPTKDWRVSWALGAYFLAGRRIAVLGDFRHDRVSLVFTEPFYLAVDEPERQKRQAQRFLERLQGALTLRNRYTRREDYQWAKIVNMASGPQYLSVMDQKGNITTEEVPYPDY